MTRAEILTVSSISWAVADGGLDASRMEASYRLLS